jgi:hypothetical protein
MPLRAVSGYTEGKDLVQVDDGRDLIYPLRGLKTRTINYEAVKLG